MSPAKTAKRRDAVSAISSYLLIVMAVGWLVMTALRETPIFWRNAGGYPVGLRMFVLDFYPIITTGLLLTGTRRTWEFFQSDRHSRVQVSLTLVFLVLLMLGLGIMVTNNVVNLIEGRPLHAHANNP